MNNNDLQIYEDEIQSLEEEIKMLTEDYESSQHESMAYSDTEIMKTMKSFKRNFQEALKQNESSPDLKTQLDLLEFDLSFIMKLTGIWFTHYSRRPVEKSETKTIQKYRLSGNCQSVPFQLEFQLVEENQSNKNVSAVVTDLNIIIESAEYSDLSNFVSRVEESGNLLLFFKSLSRFSEWCEHRKRTLSYFKVPERNVCFTLPENFKKIDERLKEGDQFKTKYPEVVVLPEGLSGDYMILRSTQIPGFELMIVWKINVDKDGKVIPALDLLSKIPKSVMEADKFASDSPNFFRSLLHVLGIQASIETLITSLCKGK